MLDAGPLGMFGMPMIVTMTSSDQLEGDPSLTGDMTEMYFRSTRPGGMGADDIYVIKKDLVTGQWSAPVNVTELNTPQVESEPEVSSDGLRIRFSRPGAAGGLDIYGSSRLSRLVAWNSPQRVPQLSTSGDDYAAAEDHSGLYLARSSTQTGNEDLYFSSRTNIADAFPTGAAIATLNTAQTDSNPYPFDQGRGICYDSTRATTHRQLYIATRASTMDSFGPPAPIAELNTTGNEFDCWLSPDLRTIYFSSDISGNREIYMATR